LCLLLSAVRRSILLPTTFVLQGNRHYHNLAHLLCMFDFVKRASKAGITLVDPAAVEWAVWFHDIIYQPSSKSNEAESAELAGKRSRDTTAATCSCMTLMFRTACCKIYMHQQQQDRLVHLPKLFLQCMREN
jgi:predicted metal-dependent HD superfamily phosphohydrolase